MKKVIIIALTALFASAAGAEPPTPAKLAPATPAAAAVTPQKTAALSQQDKMRNCNKQATGKKGAERKSFMKTCLSNKA